MARKVIPDASAQKNTDKICCHKCKEPKTDRQFYKSSSPYYKDILPWCKDCLKVILSEIIHDQYSGDFELGVLAFCRMIDIPYWRDKVQKLSDDKDVFVGKYLTIVAQKKTTNSIPPRFCNGDYTTEKQILDLRHNQGVISGEIKSNNDSFEITEEMMSMWRNPAYKGNKTIFSMLWEHYQFLSASFPDADARQKIHFPMLADLYVQGEMAGWEKHFDDYKKLQEMYISRFTVAGLSQKNNKKSEETSVGVCELIDTLEKNGTFTEPWDTVINYDHRRDLVSKFELDTINTARENAGHSRIEELPRWATIKEGSPFERFSDDEKALADRIDIVQNLEDVLKTDEEYADDKQEEE